MRHWSAVLLVFLLLPRPVAAQSFRDKLDHFLEKDSTYGVATFIAAAAVLGDYYTTTKCVHRFPVQCREANIVLVPFVKKHGIDRVMLGTVIVRAGIITGVSVMRKKRPDFAAMAGGSMLTMGGLQLAVDTSNAITLHRLEQGR